MKIIDRQWSFGFILTFSAAPTITIENDENENDAWTEYRRLFENHRSHSLNPTSGNNYLLRHSSANTSLNESASLEPMVDNHDDLLSLIEQAGISFGKERYLKNTICSLIICTIMIFVFILDPLTGSSSGDLLGSISGYHSYEPSPMNYRLKRSSVLDPSAEEFCMEADHGMSQSIGPSSSSSTHRPSYTHERSHRRSLRPHTHAPPRIATSCNIKKSIFIKS